MERPAAAQLFMDGYSITSAENVSSLRAYIEALEKNAAEVEALNDARIALVVAVHSLASNFENCLYKLEDDPEALKKARGDIAHAMKVAQPYSYNGTDAALAASEQKGGA